VTVERWANYKFVAVLSSAGFLSGLITAAVVFPSGKDGVFIWGGVFGVSMAIALAVCGVLPGLWKAFLFPVAAAVAFFLSWFAAGLVDYGLSAEHFSMSTTTFYLIGMFAGGIVGGFTVLGMISILVHPKLGIRTLAVKAVTGSLVGGILGVIGWLLGPSLGMAIWSGVHGLGLTAPTETFQSALTETCHLYSLFVVWQTGMALVLAIMLGPYNARTRDVSSNGVDV
jgi:hypothetical protein